MKYQVYQHPSVGAFHHEGNVYQFTVWAPELTNVEAIVNGNPHSLAVNSRGYWSGSVDGVQVGDTYGFRLNGERVLPDPASRGQLSGVHGESSIVDTSFLWSDDNWKGLLLSEMIIYELHVGTFSKEGTFDGVIDRLDYLKDLGVNAIELMPVAQFPGDRNWGYDGVYPFAVQASYGGVEGLKRLVNEAHHKGIAVLLDVIYNHLGPEGCYHGAFGPYFTGKYQTFWGKSINFDDVYCDGVRNYYWQNALMWLDEFHIDGLRLDAVHAIWDFGANHFIDDLRKQVTDLEHELGKRKVLIAEIDLNNPRFIDPPHKGGYGLDGQWADEFHHSLHAIITGELNGYYEDFGHLDHMARALKHSYVYTGQYSIHRKKEFGALPEENPYSQFVVFAQNHDQIGNRLLGDRLTAQLSHEQLKLVAATVLLAPQVPLLFMGEEYGERNPFQFFTSHSDPELIENVRSSRKEEFAYFNFDGDFPDPQTEATFLKCKLSWDKDESLFRFYQFLIKFRKERKAMKGWEQGVLRVLQASEDLVIFERSYSEDYLLIILNFGNTVRDLANQQVQDLTKLFDSSAETWHRPKQDDLIQPYSAVVYERA